MATGNSRLALVAAAKESSDFSSNFWRNLSLEFRSMRDCSRVRYRSVSMRRKARLDRRVIGLRNPVERKVRILKKLVPNCESSDIGVEELFRETADYIMALEMRVKVMQIMVNVITGAGDE
ncbi:basic helix-loop-helix (bHLH) DNA-bindingsuperfamily protein [Striga asiatica]|uniref:Basic helix-loop-helix (BHLH) DNA-bindingsuperfamily protein n=1 Tax=Striga asiatica TaxID=4170 RepID=A0A5A7QC81_STRAF|nr:basic helix-loop-helix (bHLH) DNA-bindingsuperfamily protein [Striga asiatica]